MHRFFVEPEQTGGTFLRISGPDYNHIRHVLRMSVGDENWSAMGATGNTGA